MLEFKIQPHIGIGPILLGTRSAEVRAALGSLGLNFKRYTGSSIDHFPYIQVEYEDDDTASFIGISSPPDFLITYNSVNVFDTPADELFGIIAQQESVEKHVFSKSEYLFPNQIVTLWDADKQYDRIGHETRVIWAQIGLGDHRYLDGINKIRNRSAQ